MSNKVLIVEDEFVVANNLRLLLEKEGYKVNGIAASAEEADERLQNHKPDIVLLDIHLEGKLSGIDIARKLKAENIAFVYLSAYSNQKILEEAKATEPYGFLVKPFRKKDLLIALEIARYRHQHSLESKLRQEEKLQRSLTEISNETLDAEQKLLKIARAMQSYIPFDFITSGIRPINAEQFTDSGFFRTGFDEYQFIGEKEILNIAGLTKSAFSLIIKNNYPDYNPVIYNTTTNKTEKNNSLQGLILKCFRLESYLAFPIALGYGLSVHYFFYSRKQDVYNKDHIALLNRLKLCLEEVANKTVYAETPSNHAKHRPVTINQQQNAVPDSGEFKSIIGNHHLLLSALDLAAQVAPYNTSVLILGESGTGKEKVAQSIHGLSPRNNGPFIKVNCAAIPPTLIESELFGHEKGAFTGATEKRKGKFEMADGGTIFLDEIGELPLAMQAKLLRVLQEKEIERVGSSSSMKVNVRIVAATNRNLEKEVANGNFRLDLYYRLNVFPVTLPPLRERKSDIEALVLYFVEKFCKEFNKPFTGIGASLVEDLLAYDWPGNIRELENVMEQCIILNDGKSNLNLKRRLTPGLTEPLNNAISKPIESLRQVQMEREKQYIISTLKKTNGRIRGINGAAEILNIKPTTLESKMTRFNISKEDFINGD